MKLEFGLKDKIVLITGASHGIGKESAYCLASHGSKIIVNYNQSEEHAFNIVKDIGNSAIAIKADVSKADEVKKMFDAIKERFGRLDVLVNNAGIIHSSMLLLTKETDYDSVFNVNLKGTFLCTQQAVKMMMRQKSGKIINLSSIVGIKGEATYSAYSASKAGIIGLTKSTAKELGRYNIMVNAIAPGIIETKMTDQIKNELKEELKKNIALGRIGKPKDVASVVLFLASDLSNYISGQIIGVDGCQIM